MKDDKKPDDGMRLNKFLAHSGVASRRKSDEIIKDGQVKVNGKVVTEMGHKVLRSDTVTYRGKPIKPESKVYILVNKPKDFITTTSDEKGRKTVLHLIRKATDERVYPVGRLDRNTTGLLLMTNDGELAQKLSHPKYEMKKIYVATLDKDITEAHFEAIRAGVTLEDGPAPVDQLAFPEPGNFKRVGIELHIGRNRIVRRIFESQGYDVKQLDRVLYAGLTKKDLPRGKWRFLKEKEIIMLKHFS